MTPSVTHHTCLDEVILCALFWLGAWPSFCTFPYLWVFSVPNLTVEMGSCLAFCKHENPTQTLPGQGVLYLSFLLQARITLSTLFSILLLSSKHKHTKQELSSNVHSSIIHNRQKMKTASISINRWMDKYNLVYSYNRTSFGHKKGMRCWHMLQPEWTSKIGC